MQDSSVTQQAESPSVQKPRRRTGRKSTGGKTGENAVDTSAANVQTENARKPRVRGPRQSDATQTAPELATEPREPRAPIQPVDGLLEMRVSNAKPRVAYCRIIRLYLSGLDSSANELQTPEVKQVKLTALGGAIGSAIFISDELIKSNVCRSVSVETEFAEVETKKAPKITLLLEKLPTWVSTEDAVLQKDRAYRKSKGNVETPTDQPQPHA